ncbi:unnamed protein product, partial [Meganyctiphanes norvegica]
MSTRKINDISFSGSQFLCQYIMQKVCKIMNKNKWLKFWLSNRSCNTYKKAMILRDFVAKLLVKVGYITVDFGSKEALCSVTEQTGMTLLPSSEHRFHPARASQNCRNGGLARLRIIYEDKRINEMRPPHSREGENKIIYHGDRAIQNQVDFPGLLRFIEHFLKKASSDKKILKICFGPGGSATTNVTTLECAVQGFRHKGELGKIRRQLFANPLPKSPYRTKKRGNVWWSEEARRWCLPNMASDRSVVLRSQQLNYELEKRLPCQFSAYFGMQSIFSAIGGILFGFVFMIMTAFSWTSDLLVNHPSIFTFGAFSKQGAKREDLTDIKFCVTLTGRGWNTKITEPEEKHTEAPNVTKTVQVVGPDPGYFGTAILVTSCALTVLQEKEKLPKG